MRLEELMRIYGQTEAGLGITIPRQCWARASLLMQGRSLPRDAEADALPANEPAPKREKAPSQIPSVPAQIHQVEGTLP